jgi:exopolysaccharide biosynthesis WecB/TagA/CpsF family protein
MLLFGVKLPQITKKILIEQILNLNIQSKKSLYFFYSEFVLRANRNPDYKAVLNSADLSCIDGRGLNWCLMRIQKLGKIPSFWQKNIYKLPFFLSSIGFILLFILEFLVNIFLISFSLFKKENLSLKTLNELILGRDFIYDLLKIAEQKNWKTLILGGSNKTKSLLSQKFPDLKFKLWFKDSSSNLMKERVTGKTLNWKQKLKNFFVTSSQIFLEVFLKIRFNLNQINIITDFIKKNIRNSKIELYGKNYPDNHTWISHKNLFNLFPDLIEAKELIKTEKPNLILVCLGGASGKQEFFIDNICKDKNLNFGLAAGLGAAIDHLGGGVNQKVSPIWMQKIGLEWLFRFINQPYRRFRILDSIFSLCWWLTVQEFMQNSDSKTRQTAVAIVENLDKKFLLVKRKNWLPGDINWSFVQGKIEKNEEVFKAAIREVAEETNLIEKKINFENKLVLEGKIEKHTISFFRFLAHKTKESTSQHQIVHLKYQGIENPIPNWENLEAKWAEEWEVENLLSSEKLSDWQKFKTKKIN